MEWQTRRILTWLFRYRTHDRRIQDHSAGKGYAFAASDEGWNRVTIAQKPQDTYYESRRRIRELTLYSKQVLIAHYKKGPDSHADDGLERRSPHQVDGRGLSGIV